MQEDLDNEGFTSAVLTDLSKAFDTLYHDLLIDKLSTYSFDSISLELNSIILRELRLSRILGSGLGLILLNYANDQFYLTNYTDLYLKKT